MISKRRKVSNICVHLFARVGHLELKLCRRSHINKISSERYIIRKHVTICGRPQRGGGTRVGAPPPGKLRIFPRYMGGGGASLLLVHHMSGPFSRFGGIIRRLEVFLLLFFPWGAFLLRFSPCGGHFIFIFQVGGGGGLFCLYGSPPPLRKLLRAPFRGVPRIWEGGAKKYFFSDLEICMSRSHALNS